MLSISIPPKISFKPALLTDNRSNVIIYLDIAILNDFLSFTSLKPLPRLELAIATDLGLLYKHPKFVCELLVGWAGVVEIAGI
jgi:hypothetical protein